MLKNRYQEILVGVGLMSLIRGIISLKRGHSTLLINDKRFTVDSYPGLFLSELETLSLLRLGKKYEIPELQDLRQFLVPAETDFVTDKRRLRLGKSPLANIKEMLRKYPELLDESDLDLVYSTEEEAFNKDFLSELKRYEEQSYEMSMKPKGFHFELQGPKWLKTIYTRFEEFLNQEYQQSKSLKYSGLLHLLSLSAEEKLKTGLAVSEIPYYFFRTFSQVYRLQDFFLATQLKRRLALLGGDYKESSVQFWQLHENKFENLLLASFEGVISGDRVLFFSHLPEDVPFRIRSPYGLFRKTKVRPVKRIAAPFPATSLTYMTNAQLLGSERPYRVLAKGSEFTYYHWPYPELPGSKPSFYEADLKEAFKQDELSLPFGHGPVESTPSEGVTLDLRSHRPPRKQQGPVLQRLPLDIAEKDQSIQGFEYWGPFRYQTLGFLALSYGIEEV